LPPDDAIVDARGLKCPLPVLKAEKAAERLAPGARLVVLATDPMAKVDIPLFCRQRGYGCAVSSSGDVLRFEIAATQRA
jgi:tRNA 2-thiouridine synthesizing protein A